MAPDYPEEVVVAPEVPPPDTFSTSAPSATLSRCLSFCICCIPSYTIIILFAMITHFSIFSFSHTQKYCNPKIMIALQVLFSD
ncbi:hypothetical protein DSUL_240006 [Desulfovibrionales bacterium]